MPYEFRPAVRENVNLLIGIAAPTGAGKTYSAMRLAKGLCGDKKFAVIDTEARRALHYADYFSFDHLDLKPPFSSLNYAEAIKAADKLGYEAIIIDSFSHEHEGEGGHLDAQEAEIDEMVARAKKRRDNRDDWELREAFKRSAWIKPKAERKKMKQVLLQIRAHLIFCLRAQNKIDFVKDEKGKTKVVPMETLYGFKGWIPICDQAFPFELTASFLMLPDHPGVPVPIKLQEQHKPFFPLDKPVTEETGRLIGEWARGGTAPAQKQPEAPPPVTQAARRPMSAATVIAAFSGYGISEAAILYKLNKPSVDQIDATDIEQMRDWGRGIKNNDYTAEQIFGTPITDNDIPV